MPTKEEVFEKIQAALVDALGVDDEDVTPEGAIVSACFARLRQRPAA
jgi:hypothetical protein